MTEPREPTEMELRVAKTMVMAFGGFSWGDMNFDGRARFLDAARAAIRAMRPPSTGYWISCDFGPDMKCLMFRTEP